MLKDYEYKYHKLEHKQFWFKATRKLILQILGDNQKERMILDIGCSGGILLDELKEKGFINIYGIDVSNNGINLCKQKGHKNVFIMDGAKTEFKDNTFDIIIASNVLEHIEKDGQALDEWNRILKNDGFLIVIVPAFEFLWSYHDIVNAHFRRYERNEIESKIKKNFKIVKISYWNFILFFPVLIIRLLQKIVKTENSTIDDLKDFNRLINNFLYLILLFENWLLKITVLPIGISIFIVAKLKK